MTADGIVGWAESKSLLRRSDDVISGLKVTERISSVGSCDLSLRCGVREIDAYTGKSLSSRCDDPAEGQGAAVIRARGGAFFTTVRES